MPEIIVISDDEEQQGSRQGTRSLIRPGTRKASGTTGHNSPSRTSSAPSVRLETFTYNNIIINRKTNLELEDGDFIRVFHIIQEGATSEVTLKGWRFRRTKFMHAMLEKKLNELCWILHVNENDGTRHHTQGMESVSVTQVTKRRHIRMTNRPFPALSFREQPVYPEEEDDTIAKECVLVCRYKYVCFYPDATAREGDIWCERALQRLRANESDTACSTSDEDLRQMWRGDTIKGGANRNFLTGLEESESRYDDLTQDPELPRRPVQTDHFPQSGSAASLMMGLGFLQPSAMSKRKAPAEEISGLLSGNIPGTKRQKVEVRQAQKNFVDLTLDEPSQGSTESFAAEHDRLSKGRATGSKPSFSVREPSAETSRIWGQMYARSEHGTVQGDFDGTLSTKLLPANDQTQPVQSGHQGQTLPTANFFQKPSEQKRDEAILPVFPDGVRPTRLPASRDKTRSLGSVRNRQRYTFGDCFCGAGGVSRGAVEADLCVQWGFDCNIAACESYKLNFIDAEVYNLWANDFTSRVDIDHKVDICHLSPPCQFFSDAHTTVGKNDETNTASLFAILELLQKTKPRVVTLEQTSGLPRRHHLFFNAVIHSFTCLGFSIRWKILNCADYGVPQNRKRCIVIASCPGEVLPAIPAPTHAKNPPPSSHLHPWLTINASIASIPPSFPNHNPTAMAPLRRRPPFNGDTQAACITTAGGTNNCHPSGERAFTLRELACLQGFPLSHRFGPNQVKMQIGNAVPPVFAKVLMGGVRQALERADGAA